MNIVSTMNKHLSLAIGIACLSLSFSALGALTAKEAVLKAIESNPAVQNHWHAFQSAGFDTAKARSGYLPSIDLAASTGQQRRDYDERGTYDINSVELSLTQMLFDGFATSGDVTHFNQAHQVRFFELLGSVDETALEALKAFDDVIRYRALLALAQEGYQEHLSVERQIGDRVYQGVARRTDLDQVSGRVALAESNLLTEAANLHDVTARYLRIVGDLPDSEFVPSKLRYPSLPSSVQDVLYSAYQGNADFHAAIKNIAALQSVVKREKSGFYPRVELRARHGKQQNSGVFDDRTDPDKFGEDTAVELSFTYNLYKGGAHKSSVKRSLSQVNLAKSERDQVCVNLRQTVQIAYNDTRRLDEQLASLKQHRDAIDGVRKAYAEQFQIGQRTLLDVLDAENEYFQASRSLVNAEHDLTLAHGRLLAATGDLLPALDIVRDNVSLLSTVDSSLGDITVEPSAACPAIAPRMQSRQDLISADVALGSDLLFAKGRSVLLSGAPSHLASLLSDLGGKSSFSRISIAVYTDNAATDAINIPLSKARAISLKNYFVSKGVRSNAIQVGGYGAMRPIASNATEAGRSANRRIEVTVTPNLTSKLMSERYHVIANSFSNEDAANKRVAEVAGSTVIEGGGKFRVSLASFPSKKEASSVLSRYKAQYGNDLWILNQ